jgi:hypothetical protein
MALADYQFPQIQTTQDASVPNGAIITPTTPPPIYQDPASIFDQTVQPKSQYELDAQTKLDQYNQLLGVQTQATQEQAQQFNTLGGNEATARLADITAQYKAADLQNAGEQQAYLAQTRGIGGYTQNAQTGGMEDINRANAVKKLGLAADAAILQGRVDTAKTLSEQAIKAKYGDVQGKIDSIKSFLDVNKDFLSRADTKSLAKQTFILQQKQKDIDKKVTEETKVTNMIFDAASQGAPTTIIQRAKQLLASGATGLEVAQALGQWGGKYWEIEKLKAEAQKLKNAGSGTGGAGGYTKGQNPIVDSWVTNIQNKKATLANVPANLKNAVSQALVGGEDNLKKAQDVKTRMIDTLARLYGYHNVVIGPNAQSFPVQSQRFGDTANAITDAETLSALLTTENIQLMKGLGSMSNIEFGNIEKIGSSLIGRDKEGNAYFKGTRANYDREIQRLLTDLGGLSVIDMSTSGTATQTQSKWQQGDTISKTTGLSSMAEYINPKAGFGVIDFNLPTPTK